MDRLARDGFASIRPNGFSYRSVIMGYAKVGNLEKARDILDRMIRDYNEGNSDAKPNLMALNAILYAMANSQGENGLKRVKSAKAFLEHIQDLYDRKIIEEGPNVISYSGVSKAHAIRRRLKH